MTEAPRKNASVRLFNGDIYDHIDVAAYDKRRDLLLIKIRALDLEAVVFGDSDKLSVGDRLVAIGNPLGLKNTVSEGILSAVRQSEGSRYLQITAPISSGNSGGPVLNLKGEVIGVVTFTVSPGQNLNFAVPINYLKPMLTNISPTSLEDFAQKFPKEKATEAESNKAVTASESTEANINLERRSHATSLWRQGGALATAKRFDEALELMKKAVEVDPAYVQGYLGLATVYAQKGDSAKALEALQSAIRLNPQDPTARFMEAIIYIAREMWTEAIDSLKIAIQQNPQDAVAHGYLGLAYLRKGLNDSAINELRTAVSIRPSYAAAYIDLATAYEAVRDFKNAIATLERYVDVASNDPAISKSYIDAAKDRIKLLRRSR